MPTQAKVLDRIRLWRILAPKSDTEKILIKELPNIFRYGVISERFYKNQHFLDTLKKKPFLKFLGKILKGGFSESAWTSNSVFRKKTQNSENLEFRIGNDFEENLLRKFWSFFRT